MIRSVMAAVALTRLALAAELSEPAPANGWWSFQPLSSPAIPFVQEAEHPIDRFLLARTEAKGLGLSAQAGARELVRRAYLDLVGLPPAVEEAERFLAENSPREWERLIERLLASPQYGERWARHWLDVARFAESSGFEHDYDREGAYHYRDFVIKALNADMPYDRFVQWQLAGDELAPGDPLAMAATGFLGAGVFPTQITANEVERTRYDAMDDMLSTSALAFLGLTVGCARCHDHKFDPISTQDYYRMLSTFTSTVRSVVELDLDPEQTASRVRLWEGKGAILAEELRNYETGLRNPFLVWLEGRDAAPAPPAWVEMELTELESKAGATFKRLENGAYLVEGKNGDQDEYVLRAMADRPMRGLRLEALAHPSLVKGGPGRADNGNIGLSRIRITVRELEQETEREVAFVSAAADFEQNQQHLSVAGALDENPRTGWAVDPQFGKDHAAVFTLAEAVTGRVTVRLEFQLNSRHNLGCFRLAATSAAAPGLASDVVPASIVGLLEREPGSLSEGDVSQLFNWWKQTQPGWQERQGRVSAHELTRPVGLSKVLICAEGFPPLRMHTQGADFFPETHLLKRGDPNLKVAVVSPGFLPVLSRDTPDRWPRTVAPGAPSSGRRTALAKWMTDSEFGAGSLVARVMVNRLWQHHFGRGLVDTPNDFGHTGARPTHPELLDWLASELVRSGWRLKPLHRLIMTSAAYKQGVDLDPARQAADPDNRFWLRRVPRRLEAEVIRDCLLAVSGRLQPVLYGPGTTDESSPRRSIYFTIKRSQLVGSMVAFDQPEPLVSQGERPVTTVAPQALFLLNSTAVRESAAAFAERLARELPEGAALDAARVERAFNLALGRPPTAGELREASEFLQSQAELHGQSREGARLAWVDFCQVLFGLNEFVYE